MALKKCKECGAEISSTAKVCPQCGKELQNIFVKHPIITIIAVIWILGFLVSITLPRQNQKATITSNNTSISKEENIINVGDVISGKDWEISIESAQFSQRVDPPVKNAFYNYYQVDDSLNTYLYVVLNCKNISTLDLSASSVATITAKYDNKYTYSSFSAIPDDTLGFTYTSITNIKPLTSNKIYFLAEMPKSISEEKDTAVEINIKFENNVYTYKYR